MNVAWTNVIKQVMEQEPIFLIREMTVYQEVIHDSWSKQENNKKDRLLVEVELEWDLAQRTGVNTKVLVETKIIKNK